MSTEAVQVTAEENGDRRQENRTISVLRVCCIETDHGISFALLRNISPNGAQIEADLPDPVGAQICYFFDDSFRIQATIAWKQGGRIGLANREIADINIKSFPRRALRVPLSAPGRVWINGQQVSAKVENISQTGALVLGEFDLPKGALISLDIGKLVLANVTVRWAASKSAGVRFERPLHISELKRIVDACKQVVGGTKANATPETSQRRFA